MIFGLFVLGVALTISAVAAYYSIAGLCAIFAAAVVPIIIMGAALELGKITATVWLHKYWKQANIQFKLYLIPAIIVLMLITSMGIFGFLSKAHMDQNITVGDSSAQVQILDEKIKTEQDNIAANKRALTQMDAQVDQMLGRTTDDKGASKAVQVRKSQAKERSSLQKDISQSQKTIAQLQEERAPLAAKARRIEAEVGPIKYIAALIYGDNPNADLLERAVRWVIILLVFVFDPLALILILAAEQTIAWAREEKEKRKGWQQVWQPISEDPWADIPPVTDEEYAKIKEELNLDDVVMTEKLFDTSEEFFEHGREIARELDVNNGYLNKEWSWPKSESTKGLVPEQQGESAEDFIKKLNEQLVHTPVQEEPIVITRMTNPESNPEVIATPVDNKEQERLQSDLEGAIDLVKELQQKNADLQKQLIIKQLSEQANLTQVAFGTQFPTNPGKGDLYLRVDYLPSKLFKWNGGRWMEVNKEVTNSYAYDQEYIKHLHDKVQSGEYDADLLTDIEQEQIQRYLNGDNIN